MAVEITEEFVWQSIPPRARDSQKGERILEKYYRLLS